MTDPVPPRAAAAGGRPDATGLQVVDLGFTYPGWPPTLRGVTMQVAPGTSAFLLGPSGIGKSTLLRCLAGLEPVYDGSVRWDGDALDALPAHRRRIGLMAQEPALFPHLRVWQNVAFGLPYRAEAPLRGRRAQRKEAEDWLQVVQFPGRMEARVDELSGGQRQRVALARTLAARPRAVLLDEPLSGLDRDLRDDLGVRVKSILAQQGVAALWVTHDEEEAFRLGDAVWRLVDGTCVPAQPAAAPTGS